MDTRLHENDAVEINGKIYVCSTNMDLKVPKGYVRCFDPASGWTEKTYIDDSRQSKLAQLLGDVYVIIDNKLMKKYHPLENTFTPVFEYYFRIFFFFLW